MGPIYQPQLDTGSDRNNFAQAFSKGLKLEFPRFDGENPIGWLRQAEKYFTLVATPLYQRVKFAEIFLVGKADHWLRSTGVNTSSLSWSEFAIMINNRFAAETSIEFIDNFKHAEQNLSVASYNDSFEELMGKIRMRNPNLIEDYFVDCFISRLKNYIKVPLRSYAPSTLVHAYSLARNYETTLHRRTIVDSSRWSSKGNSIAKPLLQDKGDKQEEKARPGSRWEKGSVFKCQEPWVPRHNKICKFRYQVHLISIQDDDTSEDDTTDAANQDEIPATDDGPELQISMHALSGTSSHASTFPLFLHVGKLKLVALVDSGSTTSFIDPAVIEKSSITISNHDPEQVTVANGNVLWTHAMTTSCSYYIQGHDFNSAFRVLEL
jgi:hypothetical protein